jgi:tRNA U34 5-methylaminomethyl-2-thiouridine-forming methyltransferase MnmC
MEKSAEFWEIVRTEDGSLTVRVSELGECYHSLSGAKSEAENLYIAASGIKQVFATPPTGMAAVNVLDVGLGLGYNVCATIAAWESEDSVTDLKILSLEKDASLVSALSAGNGPWQLTWPESWLRYGRNLTAAKKDTWVAQWRHPRTSASLHWVVEVGNAATADLRNPFLAPFDFVWQDPFSPAKNPEMWSQTWFEKIGPLCQPHCRLLTYSCARVVKDSLSAAGWSWKRIKGSGNKREWLLATPGTPALY